jgi:hypothetical protein
MHEPDVVYLGKRASEKLGSMSLETSLRAALADLGSPLNSSATAKSRAPQRNLELLIFIVAVVVALASLTGFLILRRCRHA